METMLTISVDYDTFQTTVCSRFCIMQFLCLSCWPQLWTYCSFLSSITIIVSQRK